MHEADGPYRPTLFDQAIARVLAEHAAAPVFLYAFTLERVVDGDTYLGRIDLGFRILFNVPIRVYQFYAPELSAPGGPESKAAAETLFAAARIVTVHSRKAESYQRVLCDVYLDGISIATTLIAQGHGTKTRPLSHRKK